MDNLKTWKMYWHECKASQSRGKHEFIFNTKNLAHPKTNRTTSPSKRKKKRKEKKAPTQSPTNLLGVFSPALEIQITRIRTHSRTQRADLSAINCVQKAMTPYFWVEVQGHVPGSICRVWPGNFSTLQPLPSHQDRPQPLQHARGTLGTRGLWSNTAPVLHKGAVGVSGGAVVSDRGRAGSPKNGCMHGAGNKSEHPQHALLARGSKVRYSILLQKPGVLVCWLHFCQHLHHISRKETLKRCKVALPCEKTRVW